jgi:hypothetical protein
MTLELPLFVFQAYAVPQNGRLVKQVANGAKGFKGRSKDSDIVHSGRL